MLISLKTDFQDYYDSEFLAVGAENATFLWSRIAYDPAISATKADQLNLLKKLGFNTPRHGKVAEVAPIADFLIVYLDSLSNSSESAILSDSKLALMSCPKNYCQEYIQPKSIKRHRLVQIGCRTFWHDYSSEQILPPRELYNWWDKFSALNGSQTYRRPAELDHSPIFTIDFIARENDQYKCAIDLNARPKLSDTGIDQIISPVGIHSAVQFFLNKVFP
jgi:hypothetical protein